MAQEVVIVPMQEIFVPEEKRYIKAQFSCPHGSRLPQLIIMLHGLYSCMEKSSQMALARTYQDAGYATLRANFMGHGERHKSEGNIENTNITSNLYDVKALWNYAQKDLAEWIDPSNIAISASSYGALVSLIALEKKIISPESMVLMAPFWLDAYQKPALLPASLLAKLMPRSVLDALLTPVLQKVFPELEARHVHPALISDFLKHHTRSLKRPELLSNTSAIALMCGTKDWVSPISQAEKFRDRVNRQNAKGPFIDNQQVKLYPLEIEHDNIPPEDSNKRNQLAVQFIQRTRALRAKTI